MMPSAGTGQDVRASMPMLRFHLSFGDATTPVYWKPDGKRFAGKATGDVKATDWLTLCSESTLKLVSGRRYQLGLASNQPVQLREGCGRWSVWEVDASGNITSTPLPLSAQTEVAPSTAPDTPDVSQEGAQQPPAAWPQPACEGCGDGADGGIALAWRDAGSDSVRSVFRSELFCALRPTPSGRRQYLVVSFYVEEFGWVECPVQIKVYSRTDKNARGSFSLRFVQYDFRGDSSDRAALLAVNFHRY